MSSARSLARRAARTAARPTTRRATRADARFLVLPLMLSGLAACGGDSKVTPEPLPTPSLAATVAPGALTVAPGGTGNATITISRGGGFAGPVTVSLANASAGVTAGALTIAAGETSGALALNVADDAAAGDRALTVRAAGPNGTPVASAALTLSVNQSARYTMTVSPATLAVQQGTTGAATVNLGRSGFAGGVTLTATGAPAGVSVTGPAEPVAGDAGALQVAVAANAAVGDYPITVKGTAQGSSDVQASFTLRVTQAPVTPPPPQGVRLTFCAPDVPVWVAYQSEGGAWTRLTGTTGTNGDVAYDVPMGQKGAIASVTRDAGTGGGPDDYDLNVSYLTRAELQTISGGLCARFAEGTKTLTGTTAGLGQTSMANIALGSSSATAMAMLNGGAYTLNDVADGPLSLIASRSTFDAQSGAMSLPDRLVVRRNVNLPTGSAIPVIDFEGAEAVAPATAALTITGLGNEKLSVTTGLFTGLLGGSFFTMQQSTTGTVTYAGLPAAKLATGDLHQLMAFAMPDGQNANQMRGVIAYQRDIVDRAIALGAALAQPTVTRQGQRVKAELAGQGDYGSWTMASFNQTSQANGDRGVSISTTAAYLGSGTPATWTLDTPDLTGVAGFEATWLPRATGNVSWSVQAYGGALSAMLGGQPQAGDVLRYASRTGQIGGGNGWRASRAAGAQTPAGMAARAAAALQVAHARPLAR